MIAVWLLLGSSLGADLGTFDPFPSDSIRTSALAPSTDPGAPAAVEEAEVPARDKLTARQRSALARFVSGRAIRQRGLALGAVSAIATLAGVGMGLRGAACRRCGVALPAIGVVTGVTGFVGVEVGAGMALVGAERERQGLERLGGRQLPNDGVVLGWSMMGSQVFLPGVGGVTAYGAIARQTVVNDRAYKRLLEAGRSEE